MTGLFHKLLWGFAIAFLMAMQGCQHAGVKALGTGEAGARKQADLNDLIYLKPGTPYRAVVKRFGEPTASVGSGFLIVAYDLPDGRRIYLNFGTGAGLWEISERDKNGVERRIVSPPPPGSGQRE